MSYLYLKLDDLKNRARRIAREEGVPRQQAHDLAAQRGKFQNYAHARAVLSAGPAAPRQQVQILQNWRERELRRHGTGSSSVALTSTLDALLRPHQLVGYLSACDLRSETLLVSDGFMRDFQETRIDLGKIARALQFIDATGLKPSRARRIYPKGNWDNRPPIADHDHGWYDPEARVHILSTEPYKDEAHKEPAQRDWETRWDWGTVRVAWGSIYGFRTTLYLLCPTAYLPRLREKVVRLEQGPAAISTDEIMMEGRPTLPE